MSTSVVSSKGQIVIPVAVRQDMGVDTGTRVAFVKVPEGWLLKPAGRPITALKGIVPKPARKVTVDDMTSAVRKRAARASGAA